jgi:hypothetical protein
MTARHDACPKRSECTPHACEAGGGKWPRCPVVGVGAVVTFKGRAWVVCRSEDETCNGCGVMQEDGEPCSSMERPPCTFETVLRKATA